MKNNKLIINILLSSMFIFSIIALSLIIPSLLNRFDNYNAFKEMIDSGTTDQFTINALKDNLSMLLNLIFAIIFSALSAILSAVVLFILDFKVWKKINLN